MVIFVCDKKSFIIDHKILCNASEPEGFPKMIGGKCLMNDLDTQESLKLSDEQLRTELARSRTNQNYRRSEILHQEGLLRDLRLYILSFNSPHSIMDLTFVFKPKLANDISI